MKSDIQDYLTRAQNIHKRIQTNMNKHHQINTDLIEHLCKLQHIKISVSYRKSFKLFSGEEQKAIEEINRLCSDAENRIKEIQNGKE